MQKIVVVEDEPDIREVIVHNLGRAGYDVLSSGDGHEGMALILRESPALVVLDLMLPTLDGLEICRALKASPDTKEIPIVVVTARGEERDIVRGLELGADDYVTKPFGSKELMARVRAVLRRGPPKEETASTEAVRRNGILVDRDRHLVSVDGESVPFTATELRLLHLLASHPGRVFTRDHLLDRITGKDGPVIDRNVDVHIAAIRQKVGPYRHLVETVRGVGYRFRDRGTAEP